MATSSPIDKQLYPFSTEDSKAIPLDIIRPLAVLKKNFTAVITPLVIPAGWKVASFFSSTGCFLEVEATSLAAPLVDGTIYSNTLFIPPNCVVTATIVEGPARIASYDGAAGFLIIQHIQKWAGLALQGRVSRI